MQDSTLVVFGATGDLMKKKIAPALYSLRRESEHLFPKKIIATGRKSYTTASYRQYIADSLCELYKLCEALPEHFLESFEYVQGDIQESETFTRIAQSVGTQHVLLYASVGCDKYAVIAESARTSGLLAAHNTRVIFEKPHGYDLSTFKTLVEPAIAIFGEANTFLIEHYAAKDIFSYIMPFRFSDGVFESVWDHDHIAQIDIHLWESIGVETRGAFYDTVGAMRDMGQNHVLQLLASICMERPHEITDTHTEKAELLESLNVIDHEALRVARFQYEGYTTIPDVHPESTQETAYMCAASIQTPRFAGVPVFMGSGKRVGTENSKAVIIHFKEGTPDPRHTDQELVSISFSLQPRMGISIVTRHDGVVSEEFIEPFTHTSAVQYVDEYTKIIRGALGGDHRYFVSVREVEAMWRFTDAVTSRFASNAVPLVSYLPNSDTVLRAYDAFISTGA